MSGHADRALAERRKARAVALAAQRCDYDAIAREVGYASRGTAWRTVMRACREHTAEAVEELRAEEVERLDELQAVLWERAMAGDCRAANTVVRIVEQRARLLGLLPDPKAKAPPRPVVVGS